MKADKVNAVATGGIFFITLIAAMVGFYYNFMTMKTPLKFIIIFEIIFIASVLLVIRGLKKMVMKPE